MAEWQDYIIEGTDVLKNKFGITNFEELRKLENEIVVDKLSHLYLCGMEGNFDIEHLCRIHKFLFGDIYDFAGKFREVDMFKTTGFEHYEQIGEKLEELFLRMNSMTINANNKFDVARYLADYYLNLIDIHPFREGNGRSCREFIRQLVVKKFPKYELDYTKIDKKNFQIGVIERDTYPLLVASEIYEALIIKEEIKKAHK